MLHCSYKVKNKVYTPDPNFHILCYSKTHQPDKHVYDLKPYRTSHVVKAFWNSRPVHISQWRHCACIVI